MIRSTMTLAAALTATLLNGSATRRSAPPLRHVTITARDYAFSAPAVVPAGLTAVRLVNHGTVQHELQFFRFNRGVSATTARKYLATGDVPDSVADRSGSVLIAAPGDSVREALLVDLRSGERYALLCQFRDAAGKPRHTELGMFALLEVQ